MGLRVKPRMAGRFQGSSPKSLPYSWAQRSFYFRVLLSSRAGDWRACSANCKRGAPELGGDAPIKSTANRCTAKYASDRKPDNRRWPNHTTRANAEGAARNHVHTRET